jgi:hypothetical protein
MAKKQKRKLNRKIGRNGGKGEKSYGVLAESNGEAIARAIGQAFLGKLEWLNGLLEQAGFIGNLEKLTARQVARIFGVTPQAVGLWQSKNGCPRNGDATYSFSKVLQWRIDQECERRADDPVDDPLLVGSSTTSQALEEYRRERVREARRKNDIEEGKLLPAIQVQKTLAVIAKSFRSESEALERAHGVVVGNDIRAMVDRVEKGFEAITSLEDESPEGTK